MSDKMRHRTSRNRQLGSQSDKMQETEQRPLRCYSMKLYIICVFLEAYTMTKFKWYMRVINLTAGAS